LNIGDTAPDFNAKDALGNEVSLQELLKSGPVVMLFRRYVGCPICQQRFNDLGDDIEDFRKRDANVLAVVGGSVKKTKAWQEKRSSPLKFIPDVQRKLYDLFEVKPGGLREFSSPGTVAAVIKAVVRGNMQGKPEGNPLQLPADFVIGRDGIIKAAKYGKHYGDYLSNEELLKILDR